MTYTSKLEQLRVFLGFLEDIEGLEPQDRGSPALQIPLEDMEKLKADG